MTEEPNQSDEIAAGWVAASMAAVCAALIVMGIGLAWLFGVLDRRAASTDQMASPFATSRPTTPEPWLQVAPRRDLEKLQEQEEIALNAWGRAEEQAAAVQVPIERALDAVAVSGLPRWPKVVPPPDSHIQSGGRP